MDKVIDWLRSEPVAIAHAVSSAVAVAVAFGLNLSPEQMAVIVTLINAVLALLARGYVTPTG